MRYTSILVLALFLSVPVLADDFEHKSRQRSGTSRGYSGSHAAHTIITPGIGLRLGYSSNHGFDAGGFISFVFGAPYVSHYNSTYSTYVYRPSYYDHYIYSRPDCYIRNDYYRSPYYGSYYGLSPYYRNDGYTFRSSYTHIYRRDSRHDDFDYKSSRDGYRSDQRNGHSFSTRYYDSRDWNRTGTRPLNQIRDMQDDRRSLSEDIRRRVDDVRVERDRAFDRLLNDDRTRTRVVIDNNNRSRLDRTTIRYQSDALRSQFSRDRSPGFDSTRRSALSIRSGSASSNRSSSSFGSRSIISTHDSGLSRTRSYGSNRN